PSDGLPHQSPGRALFWSRSSTSFGFKSGCACSSSATAPATCGEDIEVPLRTPKPPCSSGSVDRIEPPGALMSGLKLRSGASPYEEKLEINPPVGFSSLATWFVHGIIAGPLPPQLANDAPFA